MTISAWRAALRLAYRESWRSKGRSLLIILLIGLPVLALSCADVVWHTHQLAPDEIAVQELGAADASLQFVGAVVEQTPDGGRVGTTSPGTRISDIARTALSGQQLAARISPHAKVAQIGIGEALVRINNQWRYTDMRAQDYSSALARGQSSALQGHAPTKPDEVGLTRTLADEGHLKIGDVIQFSSETPGGPTSRRLVGIADNAHSHNAEMVYIPQTTAVNQLGDANVRYLVSGAKVTWQMVLELNQAGYLVDSRYVRLNPPPASEVPQLPSQPDWNSNAKRERDVSVGVIVGMSLVELVLLAGPAFAIGAKKDRRQIARIAAIGGSRADLRRVVLARAVVLGLTGALAGSALGVAIAIVGKNVFALGFNQDPGRIKTPFAQLCLLVAVSTLTCLCAAVVPALQAARTDVIAALSNRPDPRRPRRRLALAGVVIALAGLGISTRIASTHGPGSLLLGGLFVAEVGLVACTPTLLGLVSRLAARLPLTGRMALREAGRNRSSAAPAIAAVMACVVASITVSTIAVSRDADARQQYMPETAVGNAVVQIFAPMDQAPPSVESTKAKAEKIKQILTRTLPVSRVNVLNRATSSTCAGQTLNAGQPCGTSLALNTPMCANAQPFQPSCAGGNMSIDSTGLGVPVDDGAGVDAYYSDFATASRARAALQAGKVVLSSASFADAGQASLVAIDSTGKDLSGLRRYPSVVVPPAKLGNPPNAILPPAVARDLGMSPSPMEVLAHTSRMPTSQEESAANAALADIDEQTSVYVERGFRPQPADYRINILIWASVLLVIAATVIATALANANGEADLATLATMGGSGWLRRRLAMARAATVALIGTVIAVPASFATIGIWLLSVHRDTPSAPPGIVMPFSLPPTPQVPLTISWSVLAALCVIAPLSAVLVAGVSTRSRLTARTHRLT